MTFSEERYYRRFTNDLGNDQGITVYSITQVGGGSTLTLPSTPGTLFTVFVWKNSLLLTETTDYSRSGPGITLVVPFISGDYFIVIYKEA